VTRVVHDCYVGTLRGGDELAHRAPELQYVQINPPFDDVETGLPEQRNHSHGVVERFGQCFHVSVFRVSYDEGDALAGPDGANRKYSPTQRQNRIYPPTYFHPDRLMLGATTDRPSAGGLAADAHDVDLEMHAPVDAL
jgi:hypothetical protein